MARPEKKGLDYFPLDCTMDDNVTFIEDKYEHGFKVIIKLWQMCYKTEGYFLEWNEKVKTRFSKQVSVSIPELDNIISDCFSENVFSKKMFERYGILTSSGIQKRYREVVKASKRKNGLIRNNYSLLGLYQEEIELTPELTQLTTEISTQSKVNESKVNEIIENKVNEILKNAEIWIQTTLIQTRLSAEQLPIELKRFVTAICGNEQKINQKPSDLRDYFMNWLKYNPSVELKKASGQRATSFTLPKAKI